MSLEVTNKITVKWKIEGIKALLEKAKTEDVYCDSATFDHGRWLLRLTSPLDDVESCGCFLHCKVLPEDYLLASSKNSWTRTGAAVRFSITPLTVEFATLRPTLSETTTFSSSSHITWGWPKFLDRDALRSPEVTQADAFVLRCEITCLRPRDLPLPPAISTNAYTSRLVNSKLYSDVIVVLHSGPSPSCILAMTEVLVAGSAYFRDLCSSQFSESTSVLRDPTLLPGQPMYPLRGGENDFLAFEELLGGHVKDSSSQPPAKEASTSAGLALPVPTAQSQSSRRFTVINVNGCSYSTYHSLLVFLYTGRVSFLPPTSDYLIAFQDEPRDPPDAPYLVEPRDNWLLEKALNKDPPPCNPHALYRLADRYLMDDLKKIAQGYILRSLTVENVAYEIFCTLSKDYEAHQDEVLKFLLENWDAVKKTHAWSQSMELLEEGNLPGGAAVLREIHEQLPGKK